MYTPFRKRLLSLAILHGIGSIILTTTAASVASVDKETTSKPANLAQTSDLQFQLINLKNAIVESPHNADLRYQLGALALRLGDAQGAEKELRRAIDLGRSDYGTRLKLGEAWLAAGDFSSIFADAELALPRTAADKAGLSSLKGQVRLAEKSYSQAMEHFESALAEVADYAPALEGVVEVYLAEKELGAAELALVRAEQASSSSDPQVLRLKGDLAMAHNRFEAAEAAYQEAARTHGADLRLLRGVAAAQMNQGRFADAEAALEQVLRVNPSDGAATLMLAMTAYERENYSAALEKAEQLLGASQENPAPLFIAGAAAYFLGQPQQAQEHLGRYTVARPDDQAARRLLAAALLETNAPHDALKVLEPLAQQQEPDFELLTMLGVAAALSGRAADSTDFLKQALQLQPDNDALRAQVAAIQLDGGDRAEAIATMRKLVENGQEPALRRRLGLELVAQGDYREGLALIKDQSTPEGAGSAKALALEALILMRTGDLQNAAQLLNTAAEASPFDADVVAAQAELDLMRGSVEAARQRLQDLVSRSPGNVDAEVNLARVESRISGRQAAAVERLQTLVDRSPDVLTPRLVLAEVLLEMEQWREAEDVLLKAPEPDLAPVVEALAQVDLRAGRSGRAIQRLVEVVEQAPGSVSTRLALVRAFLQVGQTAAAADQIAEAARLAPNSQEVKLLRAQMTLRDLGASREKLVSAGEDIVALQAQASNDPRVVQLAGLWAIRDGKTEQGLALLRAAQTALGSGDATLLLADTLRALGKGAESSALLERWLAAHPNDIATRIRRAGQAYSVGDYSTAADDLRTVLENGAEVSDGHALLAIALARTGRVGDAAAAANRAEAERPDSARTHQALGLVQLRSGDPQRATRALERAFELAPGSSDIALDLAEAKKAAGQYQEATMLAEQVLNSGKVSEADLARARAISVRE
jgi:cellulose synthase operon protein C